MEIEDIYALINKAKSCGLTSLNLISGSTGVEDFENTLNEAFTHNAAITSEVTSIKFNNKSFIVCGFYINIIDSDMLINNYSY